MGKIKITKASSGKFETTEETFKKNVPFSFWTTPTFKWKEWLLTPYRSAQHWDKTFAAAKKASEERAKQDTLKRTKKRIAKIESEWLKDGGEVVISKNVDRSLL